MIKRCLHVFAPWLSGAAVLLAASVAAAQPPGYVLQQNQQPLQTVAKPPAGKVATPATVPGNAASTPAGRPAPRPLHIGLLLPLDSPSLGEAAQVVKAGFDAAAGEHEGITVSVQAVADDAAPASGYQQLQAQGATFIVGAMTRQGATRLAGVSKLPTLVLNTLEPTPTGDAKVWSLSLALEGEAQQVARLMQDEGRQRPLLLSADDGLSRRLRQAFADEWLRRGGKPLRELNVGRMPEGQLEAELAQADSVFLALDVKDAELVRPLLPADLPGYASSQLNTLPLSPLLHGIRFVDMPWFLTPGHPDTRHLPRPANALNRASERLYALGIDAWRLALLLAGGKPANQIKLGGASGELRLNKGGQVLRELPSSVLGEAP